jgi:hypothetical protein
MRNCLLIIFFLFAQLSFAQFAPAAGKPGTTAIHADSSIFVGWASGCTVERGLQDISDPSLGYATVGESNFSLGKAGTQGTVSLGDGGYAILTFYDAIYNGNGWDFAVFENSFDGDFLELAFVEVSSDGINFFRFPSTSLTDTTMQTGTFGNLDPTKINNLAGKYRVFYGTPFDLEELKDTPGLDVNNVSHIKIIDVVGSVQDHYATRDAQGNKINDPWPTPFPQGGFDLDAVGVIHQKNVGINNRSYANEIKIYPNPAQDFIILQTTKTGIESIIITDHTGKEWISKSGLNLYEKIQIDLKALPKGMYFLTIVNGNNVQTSKIIRQ